MKVVVIGLGSMGKRRIRLLQYLNKNIVIYGVECNSARQEKVKNQFNILCYSDLDEIAENIGIDCAFVCTSPQYHGEIINRCLLKGWHVFSEINLIPFMYEENLKLSEEKEKVLFLSSTPIYKEEICYIDQKIRQSASLCVYNYHIGQYLPDWHPWDNLKEFFVSNADTNGCRELLAIELPWIQNTFGRIEKMNVVSRRLSRLPIDFDDTYLIQLIHQGGNAGNLMIDVVSRQAVRHLEIINQELFLKWDGTPDTLYCKNLENGNLEKVKTGQYLHEKEYDSFINEYAYLKEIEEFFAIIAGKQKAVYDFEKDKVTLKIIDQIEKKGV